MSKHETSENSVDYEALAFEYVAGTLRGKERIEFERLMLSDHLLNARVDFWEEQLMAKHASTDERAPADDTWQKIEQRLGLVEKEALRPSFWEQWFGWRSAGVGFAMLWLLTISLWFSGGMLGGQPNLAPNSDYVAVLTDENSQALLTALTSSDGQTLWLKWESDIQVADSSVQLWAQSRRDGQIRPLVVFDGGAPSEVSLDEATLRLVRDSEFLLLTREESGGSAIDEPSEILLAKGVCVRLNNNNVAI